jgi:deoxycytidylate deaminase
MKEDPFPKRYNRYISLAVRMNEKRTDFMLRNRVVAIFFKKSKPVVVTMNKRKTHPEIYKNHYSKYTTTIHAELAGVIELHNRNLTADSVMIVRGDGSYPSQPCQFCKAVLLGVGIARFITPLATRGKV